jgi:hypothetical protein
MPTELSRPITLDIKLPNNNEQVFEALYLKTCDTFTAVLLVVCQV